MNQAQASTFSANLTEEQQNVLMAGIGLFEVRGFIGAHKIKTHVGVYDVRVRMDYSRGRPQPIVDWLVDNLASIRIEANKNGIATGYLPDDEWWHNRLVMTSWPYSVAALHINGAIISGNQVKLENSILMEKLKETQNWFKILENGLEISHHATKAECEAEIEGLNRLVPTIDKTTGAFITAPLSRSKYEIVEFEHKDYKDSIKKLIRNGHRNRFGWTDCPEFREIKNEVIAEAKDRMEASQQTSITGADIAAAVSQMSDSERAVLLQALAAKIATPATSVTSGPTAKENTEELDPETKYSVSKLKSFSIASLSNLAFKLKITVDPEATKADIINLIMEAQSKIGVDV